MSTNRPLPQQVATFSLRDVTELLLKQKQIHSGKYDLVVEFSIGVGSIGPDPDKKFPGAMVGISGFGLAESVMPSANTVDAAVCNPLPVKKKAKTARSG